MSVNSYNFCENFDAQDFLEFPLMPDTEEIYPDLMIGDSIHYDCKIIEANCDLYEAYDQNESQKYEIRNHDCMWSGRCKTDYEKNKLAAKTLQTVQQQHLQPKVSIKTAVISTNNIVSTDETIKDSITATIPTAPQLPQTKTAIQNIPPGTSLLINSRLNPQKKQSQQHQETFNSNNYQQQHSSFKVTIPMLTTGDFLKDREQVIQMRPDSPLSLDDDPPEFKHSVDLTACIMGSNNISLDTSSLVSPQNSDIEKVLHIKMLREQLEDTSGKMTFGDTSKTMGYVSGQSDLSDVLNILKAEIEDKSDKSDMDSDSGDSISSSIQYHSKSHSPSSGYGSNSPEYSSPVMHSDHSYTRSKKGVNIAGLGLETPSDSDEEIDVVSVGDKKLPTNPSDKDRRALQTKVANKITAGIVKTPSGLKTIPPRRRCSLEPYGSTTLSPAKSPLSSSYYNSSTSSAVSKYSANSSRKRHYISNSNKDDYTPSNKRRGKKQRSSPNKRHHNSPTSYDPDGADTIEKRNLHNDMERQRRIGLKNLFESLKRQIPTIKDKERAPKVNILREAAKLCEHFTREENQLNAMKQQLQVLKQRRQAQLLKFQSLQRA